MKSSIHNFIKSFLFTGSYQITFGRIISFVCIALLLFLLKTLVLSLTLSNYAGFLNEIIFVFFNGLTVFIFFLPIIFFFIIFEFVKISKIITTLMAVFLSFFQSYYFDFYLSGYIVLRSFGFDLVTNGQITWYGIINGFLESTINVMIIVVAAFAVLWKRKKA